MDAEELKSVTPLIETLYKDRNKGWRPILAFGFEGGSVTWAPKANEGASPPALHGVKKLGVWGGAVESYQCGFNQQPVQLLWAGIDVDAKGGYNENVRNLPESVAAALPEAMVRVSGGGAGSHVFIRLKEPRVFSSKAAAQAAAEAIAAPYVARLEAAGIKSDIVGRNQLWVWGGQQRDIQEGWPVDAGDLSTFDQPAATPELTAVEVPGCIDRDLLGPMCNQIFDALITNGVIKINGGIAREYRLHIVRCQEALRTISWLKPALTVQSAGTRLDEPNATLRIEHGTLCLYSFIEGRPVFKFPIGL